MCKKAAMFATAFSPCALSHTSSFHKALADGVRELTSRAAARLTRPILSQKNRITNCKSCHVAKDELPKEPVKVDKSRSDNGPLKEEAARRERLSKIPEGISQAVAK